jgi:hypothetical protein
LDEVGVVQNRDDSKYFNLISNNIILSIPFFSAICKAQTDSFLLPLMFFHIFKGPLSSNGAIVGHSLVEAKQNKTNQADTLISFLATIPELWSAMDYGYEGNVGRPLKL